MELIRQSARTIPAAYWRLARESAVQYNADPHLVSAVMLVENLERPRWFRVLERLKGRIFPEGTYGVMQVASERPLQDLESIRRAVRDRMANLQLTKDEGYVDQEALVAFARQYNPDPAYHKLLLYAYSYSQENGSD